MDFPTQQRLLSPILNHSANHCCADCDTRTPTWASLNYGVFLCSNCSGAHRALGPTFTRVKSVNLDLWKEEWFECMVLGNEQLNAYWEADPISQSTKPKMGASPQEIRRYVVQKYVKKRFVLDPTEEHPLAIYKKKRPSTHLQKPSLTPKEQQKEEEIQQKVEIPEKRQQLLLLQFDVDSQHLPSSQTHPQPELSEVTVHTEHATSFTSETSKDNFMDFNTLLQTHQQTTINQLHHSFSSQAVFNHNPSYPIPVASSTHQNYLQHPYPPLAHHSPPSHPSFNTESPVPLQAAWKI